MWVYAEKLCRCTHFEYDILPVFLCLGRLWVSTEKMFSQTRFCMIKWAWQELFLIIDPWAGENSEIFKGGLCPYGYMGIIFLDRPTAREIVWIPILDLVYQR